LPAVVVVEKVLRLVEHPELAEWVVVVADRQVQVLREQARRPCLAATQAIQQTQTP
jgi:hypothetical protein